MSLDLSEPELTAVPTILGYLPGSDFAIANELVILIAPYDSLGTDPDGTTYPAVNQSASGVGIMLELARLWQEQDLEVRRSVLFVAWGGGQLNEPGLKEFLDDNTTFRHLPSPNNGDPLTADVIITIAYAGAGGATLAVHPESALKMLDLLQEAAATTETPLADPDVTDIVSLRSGQSLWLNFTWSDPMGPPTEDTLDRIEPEKLQTYGEILSHLLTEIVRQSRY
jgi:hypothetical protein